MTRRRADNARMHTEPRPARASLDVVLPAYNEAASLPQLLPMLAQVLEPLSARWRLIIARSRR